MNGAIFRTPHAGQGLDPIADLVRRAFRRCRYRPKPSGPVVAHGDGRLAVGAEGHGPHPVLVPQRRPDRLAGCRVPQPSRPILASGQDGVAVAAEIDRQHLALVRQRRAHLLAGGRFPNAGRAVPTPRHEFTAIDIESHCDHGPPVFQRPERLARGHVPQPGRAVTATREEGCAVRAERQRDHGAIVLQGFPHPPRRRRLVPQSDHFLRRGVLRPGHERIHVELRRVPHVNGSVFTTYRDKPAVGRKGHGIQVRQRSGYRW